MIGLNSKQHLLAEISWKGDNAPDDFMSNVECRNYILNIIERIEDSSATENEIGNIYKDIVNTYTREVTSIFGIKNNNPYGNKKLFCKNGKSGTRAWHYIKVKRK